MRRLFPLILLVVLILATAGCTSTYNSSENEKVVIAVSIVPEEAFVRAVAGDLADIVVMIPPGYSPENYEPKAKQRQKCTQADIYFGIGIPAESSILPSLNPATCYIALEETVASVYPDRLIGTSRDPHIWLSPKRAQVMVQKIADELSLIDSEHSTIYHENATQYCEKITDADRKISEILSQAKGKTFIVDHPAFGYFADDYNLVMKALEENGKEATIKHRIELENIALDAGIDTIFYQDESGGSPVSQFAEAINGTAVSLAPLSGDYLNNLQSMAENIAEAAR